MVCRIASMRAFMTETPLAQFRCHRFPAKIVAHAAACVAAKVPDMKIALDGARDIMAEGIVENAELLGRLRTHMRDVAMSYSRAADGKKETGANFPDYFDHTKRWAAAAGHRALAMLRPWNEEVLGVDITFTGQQRLLRTHDLPMEEVERDGEHLRSAIIVAIFQ